MDLFIFIVLSIGSPFALVALIAFLGVVVDGTKQNKTQLTHGTHEQNPRCDQCRHWDQYQGYNIDKHKIEGLMDLGGCYQHTPVKTTEIGISTRPDFYCKHFEPTGKSG